MSALYKQNTSVFRNEFAESIFHHKYSHEGAETWEELANTLVDDVCGSVLPQSEVDQLKWMISTMRFIPGGRYLYYAGRPAKFFNNCYLLRAQHDIFRPASSALLSKTQEPVPVAMCNVDV